MTSFKQMGLLALLASGASTIWVPGLREHLPTFITGQTQASQSGSIHDSDFITEDLEELGGLGLNPKEEAPRSSKAGESNDFLLALRNFKAHRRDIETSSAISAPVEIEEDGDPVAQTLVVDWVREFPLKGILRSPKGDRAIFGSTAYAVGMEPAPGVILREILADRVQLEMSGEPLWVWLPGLGENMQAKPKSAVETLQIDPSEAPEIETEI